MPALWYLEVANVMLGAQRRGQVDKACVEKFLSTLRTLDIRADDETISIAWTRTLAIGETFSLTAYDAAYLELALRKASRLHPLIRS